MNEVQAKIYLVKYPSSLDDRTVVELARGIEPPTCGLQKGFYLHTIHSSQHLKQ